MRILFMGTAELACPCLEALASRNVVGVITQPDRPKGRSLHLTPPPVKITATKLGLPVAQPVKVRESVTEIAAYRPDLIVVVAYGQILPQALLDIPPLGCINVHTSLLPRWRGASPIQSAILAGDQQTGVTTMYIDAQLDHGDIILQRPEPIHPTDTSATLHDRLAQLGAHVLVETIELIAAGTPPRRRQDETLVTHARKFTKDDGRIDWTKSPAAIDRQVRAFNPWPGAFTDRDGTFLKVWRVALVNDTVELVEVQPAGGKRMSYEAYLRGRRT
ncbi:MAG: Methionyl-tRNA formyltransferase [Verrucomicrobiae bacterium]|nr:Methionyl-tRNA formyltransferase [Verrucomicrobiae bacterium]